MKQKTIKTEFSITGKGIHTGKPAVVRFLPKANEGIYFVRMDKLNSPHIPAHWKNVSDTNRATTLGVGAVKVRTVEHLLSALYGSGISNLRIEIEGEEVPILDGSALEYFQLFDHTGIVELSADIRTLVVQNELSVTDLNKNSTISITPANNFTITYHLNYDKIEQSFSYVFSLESYSRDIAPARTFSMLSELEFMLDQGIIRGIKDAPGFAVIDNDSKIEHLQKKIGTDLLPFTHKNDNLPILSKERLRFPDEMVRHKILDIIGDFALSGCYIQGHVEAHGTGHSENIALLSKILS
jgi:UDP-3-O-[3-hydroxymyristoyl] N-acetylglucosamine deacetylase/3-hydroxyacyl-[acyl-carrier-protein] dehydratase